MVCQGAGSTIWEFFDFASKNSLLFMSGMAITPENTSSDNVVNPPKSTMSKDESADTRLDHDLAVQAQAQEEEEDVNVEEEESPPPSPR